MAGGLSRYDCKMAVQKRCALPQSVFSTMHAWDLDVGRTGGSGKWRKGLMKRGHNMACHVIAAMISPKNTRTKVAIKYLEGEY